MLHSLTVGDDYYESSWTPPLEREVLQLLSTLGLSAAGICKVSVILLRDPLDTGVLYAKIQASQELERARQALEWPELDLKSKEDGQDGRHTSFEEL